MGPQQVRDPTGGTTLRSSQTHLPLARRPMGRLRGAVLPGKNFGVDDNQAKRGLFSAVEGAQSHLVIAGMDPDRQAMRDISFGEYLQRMGEKFRPAAESIQMKEEYLNRTQ